MSLYGCLISIDVSLVSHISYSSKPLLSIALVSRHPLFYHSPFLSSLTPTLHLPSLMVVSVSSTLV